MTEPSSSDPLPKITEPAPSSPIVKMPERSSSYLPPEISKLPSSNSIPKMTEPAPSSPMVKMPERPSSYLPPEISEPSSSDSPPYPTPRRIKGGCLCKSIRYEVIFPPDHNFGKSVRYSYQPPPTYPTDIQVDNRICPHQTSHHETTYLCN